MERPLAFLLIIIILFSVNFSQSSCINSLRHIISKLHIWYRSFFFIRSFHFHMERRIAFLMFFFFFIIILFSANFQVILRKDLTTHHYEILCVISDSLNLFGTDTLRPNTFPTQSYLPKHRKPCYHLNSETVRDSRKLKGWKCLGT